MYVQVAQRAWATARGNTDRFRGPVRRWLTKTSSRGEKQKMIIIIIIMYA